MSAQPVDVLAVMDGLATRAAARAFKSGVPMSASREIESARAAVAELIEAADAVLGNRPPAGEPGHVDFSDAIKLMRAALARCGGTP